MSAPTLRSRRLPGSPVVLRAGQWWLVSGAGAVLATDPAFTGALDSFAAALAAADQTVADLRTRSDQHPGGAEGGRR